MPLVHGKGMAQHRYGRTSSNVLAMDHAQSPVSGRRAREARQRTMLELLTAAAAAARARADPSPKPASAASRTEVRCNVALGRGSRTDVGCVRHPTQSDACSRNLVSDGCGHPRRMTSAPTRMLPTLQLRRTHARADVHTHARTEKNRPGPRPPTLPDRGRACRRILYREVTSSVPPLKFELCDISLRVGLVH